MYVHVVCKFDGKNVDFPVKMVIVFLMTFPHTVRHTVWKLLQKFRENNGFTKEITK